MTAPTPAGAPAPAPGAASRAEALVDQLVAGGVELAATLPDSWLTAVIERVADHPDLRHVRVTREDDGAAVCAGAALAGKRAVLVCQNAGALLAANGLAAYALHHQLPFLVLAAHRGDHDDGFYYQAYKGAVVPKVLDAIGLPRHHLKSSADDHLVGEALDQAWLHQRPVVVLCSRRALLGDDR